MRHPLCLLSTLALATSAAAQSPLLRSVPIATNLSAPLVLTAAHGDLQRAFVVEYLGRVRILNLATSQVLSAPFLDISGRVAPNGGMLGLAIDPDFATTRHLYVYWIDVADGASTISRFTASASNPNVVEPGSETLIWRFPRPFGHHGGWLAFGPDNNLWLSSGDAGHYNVISYHAQDLTSLMGKLLRIDPRADGFPADPTRNYAIPGDNPDLGAAARPEIFSYGLRNAFRGSFDQLTGDLYLADVGHNDREELNILARDPALPGFQLPSGQNFGWPCREGFLCTPYGGCDCNGPLTSPSFEYTRTIGRCITGGFVYRGQSIPGLQGTYVFADFEDHKYFSLYRPLHAAPGSTLVAGFRDRTAELQLPVQITQPASLGEDAAGELYILSFNTGTIYRIAAGEGHTSCYANCDASTLAPALNIADFTCFLQRFAAGDPYANCDRSTQAPVLNVADFTCYLQNFAAGCS